MYRRLLGYANLISIFAAALFITSCGAESSASKQYELIPAVLRGDTAAVMSLINEANVDVNWRAGGTGTTALISASAHSKIEIAKVLLTRGADPNGPGKDQSTPLQVAAYHGNVEILQMLIAAGAQPNIAESRYGYTPLAYASMKGHIEVVRLLLAAGADVNQSIYDGRTPMQLAAGHGYAEVVKLLRASSGSSK